MRRRDFFTLVSGARALSAWRPAPRCRLPTVACAPDDRSMLKYSESSSTVHSFIPERPDSQHPRSGTCQRLKRLWYSAILLIALLIATPPNQSYAQQPTVSVGANDIGGVVTGTNGPEAGVWVIAETKDLPTPFAKIVVTDDRGRYLIPDLPKANYSVWVRGYGLADSPKCRPSPERLVNLRVGRPTQRPTRKTIRRSTGSRCCRCRRRRVPAASQRKASG